MRRVRKKNLLTVARTLTPTSTVSLLTYVTVVLFIAYIVAVIMTVYFATLQTTLVATIHEHEGAIIELESTYYEGIAHISSANPQTEGYVTPTDVTYITERTSHGLSFAGR